MNIFEEWALAKPHIERAVKRMNGTHTIDDVALMVGNGCLKILLGDNCAMVTEVRQYPRMREMNVFAAGGDLRGLLALESKLIERAKQENCTRVTEMGRKGWEKALPGIEVLGTALYRDIGA